VKAPWSFAAAAHSLAQCPRWGRREIAIVGRSNVGKSSLINALAASKGLARTSSTPGRTQALNFFTIGEELAIVDLPGFGYARMPAAQAARLGLLTEEFLDRREALVAIVLLVDIRREPGEAERELAFAAQRRGLKLIVAATKCDKVGRAERAAARTRLEALGRNPTVCSAVSGEGIEPLRRALLAMGRAAASGARRAGAVKS
jgi:GTP-binding protein